ncbi:MAG: TetR/AcrR family transcriptional repressor of nem operon [Myxococcota bacterium]|jgi:TetR/AcrR family transcriptional repressor of nem operon
MILFWERGFEAASVQDLTTAMGINRFSMYNTFDDKQTLFLTALDHYTTHHTARSLLPLEAPRPDLGAIKSYFDALLTRTRTRPGSMGCMMALAGSERPQDPDTIERVNAHNTRTRLAFERALRNAADDGQLRPGIYPRRRAAMLTTFTLGLALQTRAGTDLATLRATVDAVLGDLAA